MPTTKRHISSLRPDPSTGAAPDRGFAPAPPRPSPEQIRRQVAQIVEGPHFAGGPKTKAFLEYIVEQALQGNARNLKQYTIATEVLGRDSSFNPEIDPMVRLEAGKLRRALEMYYFRAGASAEIRIDVPKGSYVPVFELNSPPLSNQVAAPPVAGTTAIGDDIRQLDAQRLGIVPFSYQPDHDDCRVYAEGLFDQLTVALARYRDIAVIPMPAGADPIPLVSSEGAHLKARFVLSGSVRQSDSCLRITGRLHDADTNSIVWTESFDIEKPVAALESQDRLATYVAGAIADYYGVISHTLSLHAVYGPSNGWNLRDSIHRHRYLARTLTERVYRLARADLQLGIERAPNHPMIWAALAHTIFYGNVLGFDRDDDWKALVFRYAQQSFELDHRCAFAHVVMALHQLYEGQFNEVLETSARILEHNPHAPSGKLSAGFFRALAGDWDRGAEMLTSALGTLLHPPGWAYRVTCLNHFRQEQYELALREVNKYHAPEHFTPSLLRAAILSRLGRIDDARAAAADVLRISPNFREITDSYFRYLVPFEEMRAEVMRALRPLGLVR